MPVFAGLFQQVFPEETHRGFMDIARVSEPCREAWLCDNEFITDNNLTYMKTELSEINNIMQ